MRKGTRGRHEGTAARAGSSDVQASAVARGKWRGPAGSAARALSPRGALALHRVDGAFLFALRAALAMAVVALPIVLAGRPDLAVYAMLGSFTTTFGRNVPYARRARVLAVVGVAMTACVGCGSALAAWADPRAGGAGAVVVAAATAVVAGATKFGCDATRLGGLGAVLLLFSFAVAANSSATFADVLPRTGLAAAASLVAWALAVTGWFVHPDRPQRLAVAAALRALAQLLEATAAGAEPARQRHRATIAVLAAYDALGLAPPTHARQGPRGGVCVQLTDMSWSILVGSAGLSPNGLSTARRLRLQAQALADRRRRPPPVLPGASRPTADPHGGEGRLAPGVAAVPERRAARRASELITGCRRGGPGHLSVWVVPALRMLLGTGVSGALALLLGLGHGYWAAISAAAVLHSVNVRTTAQRAVQRSLGTVVGLLLALAVLAAHPGPAALAVVVVVLEFLLEYVVVRNYGLGVVFLTPLALLMSDLAAPESAGELVHDRGLASLLGIVVGLLCALLVSGGHAAVRAERALAQCEAAAEQAERALAGPGPPHPGVQMRLAQAVVELREADDAAAGELWSAGIDPVELAAAEQRGYLLLAGLLRRRWE
ncbi:FUSC family protein [Streptomyces broussonetiae]|uniref:FUSC family protein n=1 Tax=Streptomyces broussonetiae TaxID=2686304 RepID=A0A6I6NBG6_9ACTN|nr:FUSC family protein [Streptomyces broussonetiae]